MNCPFCGKEMETGCVQTNGVNCWLKTPSPPHRNPHWRKDKIVLYGDCENEFQFPYINGWRCADCDCILLK